MAGWDFSLLRRNSPTLSERSNSSTISTSSTTSLPIIYDTKTCKVEVAPDWKDVGKYCNDSESDLEKADSVSIENNKNIIEAEAAGGSSLLAELKLNIGSELKPIMDHLAWVDLSKLRSDARHERKNGRINSIFVRV